MKFKQISTFLSWAVFTFVSHFFAKIFLSNTAHVLENVVLLTALQMATGSVIFIKLILFGEVNIAGIKAFREEKYIAFDCIDTLISRFRGKPYTEKKSVSF